MKDIHREQGLAQEATDIGIRYENVIIESEILSFSPTTFLYDESLNDELLPIYINDYSHIIGDSGGYRDYSGLNRALKKGRTYSPSLKDKLAALAVPASAASVEVISDSTPGTIVAALGSLAIYSGYLLKHRRDNYYDFTDGIQQDLEDIKNQLHDGENAVRLNNLPDIRFEVQENIAELLEADIPVAGSQAATMKAKDVLKWYENLVKPTSPVFKRTHGYFNPTLFDVTKKIGGPYIKLDARFSSLVFTEVRGSDYDALSPKEFKYYKDHCDSMADELGIKLETAKQPDHVSRAIDKHIDNGTMPKEEHESNWRDARLSIIHLPAGMVVKSLLHMSDRPNLLWEAIAPDAKHLQLVIEDTVSIQQRLTFINKRAKHTGVQNSDDERETDELKTKIETNRREILALTLSIISAATLQSRQKEYDEIRQELIDSLSHTHKAEDQFGAIHLFGAAIDSLALTLEPDSEEAIDTAAKLRQYLIGSLPFLDGSESAYNQVFAGLQAQFPQLKLFR